MVGASKILTVSYGTFSCTLEGFDEPFNTMKAIAEYFRDLAADDRYFGAEPPQPDAEMLHRIAEREIQRRVEAKVQRNGVILRQTEVEEPAPDTAAAPAPAPEPAIEAPQQIAAEAPAPAAPAAAPAVFEVPQQADPVSESVAAKLQRIRAAVATARAAAVHAPEPQAEEAEQVAPSLPVSEAPVSETADEAPIAEAPVADFGFSLDISGPLSVEETAQISEAEAALPAAEEPVTIVSEPALLAEAEDAADDAMQEAEEAGTEAVLPVAEPEPVQAPIPEDSAPEPVVETEFAPELAAERAPAAEIAAEPETQPEPPRPMIRARVIKVRRAEPGARPVIELQERVAETDDDAIAAGIAAQLAAEAPAPAAPEPASALTEEQEAELLAELAALAEDIGSAEEWAEPAPAPVAELAPVDPDDFADGDYSEVVVDTEEFDADMAAELEETLAAALIAEATPVAAAPETQMVEPETVPMPADADYSEVLVDTEEFDADLAARIGAEVVPAPELPEEALMLEAPDLTPVADPHAFADGDYAEVVLESEEPEAAQTGDEGVTEVIATEPGFAEEIEPEMAAVLAEMAQTEPVEPAATPADVEDGAEDGAEEEVAAVLAGITEAEPEAEVASPPEPEAEEPVLIAEPAPELPPVAAVRPAPTAKKLPDDDLSRLMTEADAQMAGTENRRRISAIAHLKAAVAATVAERRLIGTPEKADETVPYRDDLNQAVRPRRPISQGHHAATARPVPAEARPAPLVLVSEQRVDRSPAEANAEAAAIRPRRISTATLHAREEIVELEEETAEDEAPMSASEATSFAEFAEGLGTQGLSDLLEAAAAYTAQIEGRPHFSPPQIMRKLSAIGSEGEFSREDRLRVFGRLLRQGKIAKVKRGQYAITEASRYYDKRA